jgi:diguanylate cyclase (GGDEF)-like protein
VIEKIDVPGLAQRTETLRSLVQTSGFGVKDQKLSVTISLGGTLARPGEEVAETLKRADELLYRSKSAGRNRSTVED